MICLAVGLGVLGAIAFRRARRCHHRGGYGWRGPYGHHHWRHHGPRSWMLHAALERIDASPAQERFIIAELDKLSDRVHAAKTNLRDARGDLGAAVRGPVLDDAALGAVMGKVDSSTAEARAAGIDALRAIHGVLDEKQRAMLADLLDRGASRWWRQGPYR
jgi:Spy/CpxP family protein refolding chaperone